VLFVGTKRQAQAIVRMEADAAGAPYFAERWIGGFLTNWDQIKKNIEKINRMEEEQKNGGWKRFPKHEQVKMARYLDRIKVYYGGVLKLTQVPQALLIIDVKKEIAAVREGQRRGLPIVGVVDTNSDPTGIDYVIPANDDAIGSVSYLVHALATAYKEAKESHTKELEANKAKEEAQKAKAEKEAAAKMTVQSEEKRLAAEKAAKEKKATEEKKA
jgi:small subunit ribosomal protein S2